MKEGFISRINVVFIVMMLMAHSVLAGEDVLYDELPPVDASFFRFANGTAKPITVKANGNKLATIRPGEVSPYGFVSAAQIMFEVNTMSIPLDATAGRQVTILLVDSAGGSENPYHIFDEGGFSNKRKARVKLYNFIKQDKLSLKTGDGAHEVINEVNPMSFDSRDVNAIQMNFSVFGGANKLTTSDVITLKRDRVTSFFVFSDQSPLFMMESDR